MGRPALLIGVGLLVFGAVAALGVKLMPQPLREADYMVIGAAATLMALLAMFIIILSTSMKGTRLITRRPKTPRKPGA